MWKKILSFPFSSTKLYYGNEARKLLKNSISRVAATTNVTLGPLVKFRIDKLILL